MENLKYAPSRKQISKHERNTKQLSTRKLREMYDSEAFKDEERKTDLEAKARQAYKDCQQAYIEARLEGDEYANTMAKIIDKEIKLARSSFKILVVDDDSDMREMFVDFLKDECGFISVDTASGGMEAMGRCGKKQYDLILSDFSMPDVNGAKLWYALNDMDYKTNFMLVSGYGREQFKNLQRAGIMTLPKDGDTFDMLRKIVLGYYVRKLNQMANEEA